MKDFLPEIRFCTECGDDLENFCFSARCKDIQKVKDQLEECKRRARFNGELCSKFFIAKEFSIDINDEKYLS